MEDSFQFIIESPQHSQGHKKRPRLVTSCDNCRLKKIKCLQPSPEAKCEACKASKIPCRFRDRERYFAERSRAIAGPNSGVYATELRSEPALDAFSIASGSSSPSMGHNRSNSHSPKASGMVSPDMDHQTRYYSPDSRHHMGGTHTHSSSISSFDSLRSGNGLPYNYPGPGQLQFPPNSRSMYQPDPHAAQTFDPANQHRPHPELMPLFFQVFFEKHGHGPDFSFLSYQELLQDFWDQRISLVVVNCIASMVVKDANLPDISARDLHNISELYVETAKRVYHGSPYTISLEALHGLMLLCWAEHYHHRLPSFRSFFSLAVKMSQDLGLQSNLDFANDYDRNRKRATYTGLMQLQLIANTYRS